MSTDVIRDLPTDERPRERLLMHGPQTLSDSELVAILLGSGFRGKNAIQLARELLADGMSGLRRRELSDLAEVRGMGPAKAARIGAVMEIARRLLSGEPDDPTPFDSDVLARRLVGTFSHHAQERLGVAFLDSRHHVIKHREVFVGSLGHALVSTRDVIRYAMLDNAAAVALYHNHPSGNPAPSQEDLTFTAKMKESLSLCDIELVEHLIIGAHRYCSMKQTGHI
jgi:DNA repair protein RadC